MNDLVRLSYDAHSGMFLLEAWEMWKDDEEDEDPAPSSPRTRARESLLRLAQKSARAAFLLTNADSGKTQARVSEADVAEMEAAMDQAREHWDEVVREKRYVWAHSSMFYFK